MRTIPREPGFTHPFSLVDFGYTLGIVILAIFGIAWDVLVQGLYRAPTPSSPRVFTSAGSSLLNRPLPKIAIALEYPLSMRGGVSVLVEELTGRLAEAFQITLISPDSPQEFSASPAARFSSDHLQWDPLAVSRQTSQTLAEILRGKGILLAHLHSGGSFGWGSRRLNQSPIPYLHRAGITCLVTNHQVDKTILGGYCGPQKPLWFKFAILPLVWLSKLHVLAHLHAEITVSRHDLQLLRRWYWPFRRKFQQIYHSRISSSAQRLDQGQREEVILSVGHIAMRKGQHILAEAFARIAGKYPRWKLLIAGHVAEDSCLQKIQSVIIEHGLQERILLLGNRDDALALMRRAQIFVQPSTMEALGLALQEALYAGCICLGSRVGGIPEMIEEGQNGLVFSPGNVDELALALNRAISDEPLRKLLTAQGPETLLAKQMTADHMAAQYVLLYQSILALRSISPSRQTTSRFL